MLISKYSVVLILIFCMAFLLWAITFETDASEQKKKAIENMFEVNLAVKKGERVLVFTDDHKPEITEEAKLVAKIGASFGEIIFFKYPSTGQPGIEPPKSLWEKTFGKNIIKQIEEKKLMKRILDKRITEDELEIVREIVKANKQDTVNVVIGLAWFSTSHTNFRKLLTAAAGGRFASMPGFDPRMWTTAMSANWEEVARRTIGLKEKLSGAISAHVRTPNGTEIFFDLTGREFRADTGLLDQPGRSGNLPAGEVYIAPLEGNSNGKMVIEPGINPWVNEQSVLEIKGGNVYRMEGDSRFIGRLEEIFSKYPLARNIAEFGIGTNDKAKAGTTLLELEKVLGTIHVAIGDNSAFGGKVSVPLHIDFVFENPTVVFKFPDGKTLQLMKDGNMLLD
ncbi:MAG: peptidase [Deltaproteobacteria bacterium]|nr:peptidase [Deltaproteobacteria bacterium]